MNEPGRILAIDYGEKRVGLAMTDPLAIIASGFNTIQNNNRKDLIKELLEIIQSNGVNGVVVGIPYSLDGESGPMAESVKEFVRELESSVEVKVETWPEEYSSEDAKSELRKLGVDYRKDKGEVDKMAAALILRSYLDHIEKH
ncbi:MAG: Holliday junction resolvase RuvX [Candidatus Marinimicrobia bacterium]|nr:Holliday junction resolvase RuvX [Candidatus Neomarinimicrobiota bacterium]